MVPSVHLHMKEAVEWHSLSHDGLLPSCCTLPCRAQSSDVRLPNWQGGVDMIDDPGGRWTNIAYFIFPYSVRKKRRGSIDMGEPTINWLAADHSPAVRGSDLHQQEHQHSIE